LIRRCAYGNNRRRDNVHSIVIRNGNPPSEYDLTPIQASIRRMMEEGILVHGGTAYALRSPLGAMSLEDRREYIENVLRTKVRISIDFGFSVNAVLFARPVTYNTPHLSLHSIMFLLQRVILTTNQSKSGGRSNKQESTDDNHVVITKSANDDNLSDDGGSNENQCAICLTEYVDGDEISMAHNRLCNHVFHKACISNWLLNHEECPCCRNEYLSFNDDDDDHEGAAAAEQPRALNVPAATNSTDPTTDDEENSTLGRGMRLFYQFTGRVAPTSNADTTTEVELPTTMVDSAAVNISSENTVDPPAAYHEDSDDDELCISDSSDSSSEDDVETPQQAEREYSIEQL